MTYSGTFPHPTGFWTFTEEASVEAGSLETEADGSRLTGSGSVQYSIAAHGRSRT